MTDHLVDADSSASDDDRDADQAAAESGSVTVDTGIDAEPADTGTAGDIDTDDAEQADTVAGAGDAAQLGWWARWRERRRNRVSRWDRPPPPKDWRYFVGGFGKILIVTGLLMFGFVAYQLWGTGIETARAQSKLGNEFDEQIAASVSDDDPAVGIENWVVPRRPVEPGDDPADEATAPSFDTGDPVADSPPDDVLNGGPIGKPSEIVPGGVDLTDFAIEQDVPVIPGEAFARLDIPKIDRSDYVVPGVRLNDLKKGPGHYPDTPLPGQLGNASIAGHRTTFGSPFFDLDQLEPGDELIVTMVTGDRFVYEVTGLQIVTAADSWVISTRDPTVAEMTLTTCHPKYTARDRLIVSSVLVPEKSAQVGVAEFYDFDDAVENEPIPGDDPTFTDADSSDNDTDDVAAGEAEPGGAPGTTPAAGAELPTEADDAGEPAAGDSDSAAGEQGAEAIDEPLDTGGAVAAGSDGEAAAPPAADPDQAELDAFEQGWFDDREAFPQIALWASILLLITVLGYQVAKRTRHTSIGVLVSFAPFFVALYFFYQNVNRLLPPGL